VEALEDRIVLDVGDTLATALNTLLGPGAGSFTQASEPIGDGPFGTRDVDLYQFQANAGLRLTATTSQPPGGVSLDSILRLFNSSGVQLAFNDDFGGTFYSQIVFTFTTTGTYYIGVSGFANFGYNPNIGGSGSVGDTGDYRLVLTLDVPPPPPVDVPDTIATALNTGLGPASGTFTRDDQVGNGPFGTRDVDIYRFEAFAGATFRALTALPPGGRSMDTILRLFDANGSQLAVNDDDLGLYSRIDFEFEVSGTYYVGVSGFANFNYNPNTGGSGVAGSTGDYRLTLTLTAPVPGEIRGTKFHDLNRNGQRDAGEPGLPGWTIYLDGNRNGVHDAGEPATTTDANGNYVFTGVLPGIYTVAEVPQTGWVRSAPTGDGRSVSEGFDSGSLNAYEPVIRSLGSAEVSAAAAHDGIQGLLDFDGDDWIVRNDAAARVARGDTFSVWVRFAGAADARAYFGFGARAPVGVESTGRALSVVLAPNTNQLLIQQHPGFTYQVLGAVPQTYQADTWYRVEVSWGTTGLITARLFGSDGTTLLNTVTATNTSISSGGIAFRGFGSDKHWDTVTVNGVPGTYRVGVNSGQVVTGLDFGNYQVSGLIPQAFGGPAPGLGAGHGAGAGDDDLGLAQAPPATGQPADPLAPAEDTPTEAGPPVLDAEAVTRFFGSREEDPAVLAQLEPDTFLPDDPLGGVGLEGILSEVLGPAV
jgi:hypothetical protein